jgi:UDP-glucose 4-epimerase
MTKKSITLIGGGGFIGINLSDFFVKEGYEVLVISRSIIETQNTECSLIKKKSLDVNKTSNLIEELLGSENIVWLVNDIVPGSSMDSLVEDFTFNISPLVKFLESSHMLTNLKRFVFISSGGTIYGESHNSLKFDEDSIKNPISAYGLSKLIAEEYVNFITQKSSFQSYILRPSNVYGNHQNLKKPQGIIGYAFNAALNGKSIDVYGDGEVIRDFVHVLDFAEALKQCIEVKFEKSIVEIYNIGSQEGYSVIQILNFINEISGTNTQHIFKPSRAIDCNFSVLNTQKIKNKLGWYPKIQINDGLDSVWKWLNSNEKKK